MSDENKKNGLRMFLKVAMMIVVVMVTTVVVGFGLLVGACGTRRGRR